MKKHKHKIPSGDYCYKYTSGMKTYEDGHVGMTVEYCKYREWQTIAGVPVDYCSFLKQHGLGNKTTDEQFHKLVLKFGSKDAVYEKFPLDLLFDGIKCCNQNVDSFSFHSPLSSSG